MSSEKSWQQIVREADPDEKEDIVIYEFGGGQRKFKEKQDDPYGD